MSGAITLDDLNAFAILFRRSFAWICTFMIVGILLGEITPTPDGRAWIHGSVTASVCPYPLTAATDGCTAGVAFGGSYRQANFWTYAPSGGTTYQPRSSIGPFFNLPVIDYGSGANSSTSVVDPTVASITGCTYSTTGSEIGGPALTCTGANPDVENVNFFPHGQCVELVIGTAASGTLTTINNTHDNGSSLSTSCASASVSGHFVVLKSPSNITAWVNKHNTYLGEAANITTSLAFAAVGMGTKTAITITSAYNVGINLPDRLYNATAATIVSSQDYVDGFCLNCSITGTHGEIIFNAFEPFATGSISNGSGGAGTTLTITSVNGTPTFSLAVGTAIGGANSGGSGTNILAGTTITGSAGGTLPCSGAACIGSYTVNNSQNYTSGVVAIVSNGSAQYSYDVCLHAGNPTTTCFYLSTGGGSNQASQFTLGQVDHSVAISNTPSGSNSATLVEAAWNHFLTGSLILTSNFVDQSQSFHWSAAISNVTCDTAATFTGNVDLVSGATLTTWGTNSGTGC